MKIPLWSLVGVLLIGSGCYRANTRSLWVDIPEAQGHPGELEAIKQHLLHEQSRLSGDIVFYQHIRVDTQKGGLEITYNREHLADMNVIGKINQLGYRVHALPGDPTQLIETRKKFSAP